MESEQEKKVVLQDNERYKIEVDITNSILYVKCRKHLEADALHAKYLSILDIINTYKLKYLLTDVRSIHHLNLKDASWLISNVIPAMKDSTLLKYARLEDAGSMLHLNSMHLKCKLDTETPEARVLQFETFVDEESALHWLLNEEE
ncbi:hypothetical protein POKO110462_03050 [Pontibacter korlensis]|uniref:STAS/SEC14 domain-containing protein n=2 Tax=Pontibacter korlensis TaxID=400092 RepID=A0A0E3ZH58_9BACT|nr:hypothetical protein PKOR_13245 [Pontibacter korlensis]